MKIGYLMQAGVPDVRERPLSGAANHVKHTIVELQKLGHQVRLVAMLPGAIYLSDDLTTFEPVPVAWASRGPWRLFERVVRRTQSQLRLPYAAWFESQKFAWVCRQKLAGFDLLYERMGWVGYGGGLAARKLHLPHILEVNGDHLTEFTTLGIAPTGLQRWLSITLMNRMIGQATRVVTTGDGWRKRFLEQWDIAENRVMTIENGSEVVDLLERAQLRAFQPGPPAESRRPMQVAFIGGFDPWQGLPTLFKALALAQRQNLAASLLIIGSGAQQPALEQLATELGIRRQLTFAGRLTPAQFAPLLAEADVAVSPYCGRAEFSGLKLLDYKAAGLPTIASGQNGQPAILKHGHTGWIVPPCDEQALCQALITLAAQPELRQKMGQAARLEAEQRHSWRHTATQLEQLFIQVIG